MAHLLHIGSSPRDQLSRSRRFTRECVHVENEEVGGTGLAKLIANAGTQIAQLVAKKGM